MPDQPKPSVLVVYNAVPGPKLRALCRRLEREFTCEIPIEAANFRFLNRKIDNLPVGLTPDILVVLSFTNHFPEMLYEFLMAPRKILVFPTEDGLTSQTLSPADATGFAQVDLRADVGPAVEAVVCLVRSLLLPVHSRM